MRKILLSLTLVAGFSFAANSQILYDQEGPLTGASGVISNQYTDASADTTIVCADDFGTWTIDRITVNGFRNDAGGGFTMVNMTVELLADAAGAPATSAISTEDIVVSVAEPFTEGPVVLDITDAIMTEGTYWVSTWGDAPAASRWNWSTVVGAFGNEAHLIDADDWFGLGATAWSPFTSLGLTSTDLSFSIGGTGTMVSIPEEEQITLEIYPNPALDVITITTAVGGASQATIYDANGSLIISHVNPLNTIDVSELAAGVYILEVTTPDGMAQQKFIKQ